MSILGVVVRARPEHRDLLSQRLAALAGVELAQPAEQAGPDDGRLVVVIEDQPGQRAAAATLAEIALWPEVLNTSLVYEYSGRDSPAPGEALADYTAWRSSLRDLAKGATD